MNTRCAAVTGPKTHRATQHSPRRQRSLNNSLNAAAFERLLYWLDPDPESAGLKYESIRDGLIMMFRARHCDCAEDLADTTFERVTRKLAALTGFTGDPARYFFGVAKKVYLEYRHETIAKRKQVECSLLTNVNDQDMENLLLRLDDALSAIPQSDRDLILTYYTGTGRTKINHRQDLATQFGLGPNSLRLRVFRIRRVIKNYMLGFQAPQ